MTPGFPAAGLTRVHTHTHGLQRVPVKSRPSFFFFLFFYTAAKYLTGGRCICLTCLQDRRYILSFYASPAAFGKINKGLRETSVGSRGRAGTERYY